MEIIKNEFQVKSNLNEESTTFGIKDMGKIAHLLVSQYANPIQTLVQEYVSNALDATNEAGHDQDIVVNIPNMLNNYTFSVRDFGVGLSKDRIYNIFTQFGGTTKDTSNGQIGGFGIGAKSGLAYANKFYATSFIDGTKTKYMIFKTSNGVELKPVFKESTEEPNGVLIEVETNQGDHNKFKNAVYRMANFLPKRPIINEALESQYFLPNGRVVNDNVKLFRSDDLRGLFNKHSIGKVIINYGGVPYIVDYDDVRDIVNAKQLYDFIGYGTTVVINCEIGKFMPIQTREQLDYSSSLTQAGLLEVFSKTLMSLQEHKAHLFDDVKTIAEMRNRLKDNHNYFGERKAKMFKGIEISTSNIYTKNNFDVININRSGKGYRGSVVKKVSYDSENYFEHTDRLFYINVNETDQIWKRRVRYELMENNSKPVIVLRPKKNANKKQMKVFRKVIQDLDVRPISELEMPVKTVRSSIGKTYVKKENTKVYLNKANWIDLSTNTKKYVYCEEHQFSRFKRYMFEENNMRLVFSSKTHIKKLEKDANFTHIDNYSLDNLVTDDMINATIADMVFGIRGSAKTFVFNNRHLAKGKIKRYLNKLHKYWRNGLSYSEVKKYTISKIDMREVNKLRKELYKLNSVLDLCIDPREGYYRYPSRTRRAKNSTKKMNQLNKLAEVL